MTVTLIKAASLSMLVKTPPHSSLPSAFAGRDVVAGAHEANTLGKCLFPSNACLPKHWCTCLSLLQSGFHRLDSPSIYCDKKKSFQLFQLEAASAAVMSDEGDRWTHLDKDLTKTRAHPST